MTLRKLNRPQTFNNDLDQFFNDFFHSPLTKSRGNRSTSWGGVPAVNIQETAESFMIEMAAPGLQKQDFILELDEGVLSISAETKQDNEEKKENYSRREFNFASFERRFTIPENVKEEEVKASYVDGILKVEIPKLTEQEQKAAKKLIEIS